MYNELIKILNGQITPFEYTKIEELKQIYTEQEILNAYKNSSVKNINYITKVLETTKKKSKNVPEWLNKELTSTIDEESKKEMSDFKDFLEDFRSS